MGILGIGAGASGGLDNYLHQLLQEQQQAEAERKNRATEALATRGQDLSEAQHRLAIQQRGDILAETERQHTAGRAALRGIGDVVQPGEATQEIGAGVPSSAYSKIPGLRSASTTGFQTAPDVTSKLTGFGGTPQSGQASTVTEQGPSTLKWAGTGAQREKVTADQLAQQKQDLAVQKQTDAEGQSRKDWERAQAETERHNRAEENKPSPSGITIQQGIGADGKPEFYRVNKNTGEATPVTAAGGGLLGAKRPAMEQNRIDTAPRIAAHIDPMKALLEEADQRGLLGPAMGRWSDLLANKLGSTGNPADDYLMGQIAFGMPGLVSGFLNIHAGQRGAASAELSKKWGDVMNAKKMSKDRLFGALEEERGWLNTYGSGKDPDVTTGQGAGVPTVGSNFQGGKVLKVTPIK